MSTAPRNAWGALPQGETHDPAPPIQAGQYVHTPNGRGLVLWIHHDHQWEFGRRIGTRVFVGVRLNCGHTRTYAADELRA